MREYEYPPLGSISQALPGVFTQTRPAPTRVGPQAPALDAMTDFTQVAAATIGRSASLAIASDCMYTRSVRALFVVASLKQAGRHGELARDVRRERAPAGGVGMTAGGHSSGTATVVPAAGFVRPPPLRGALVPQLRKGGRQ